MPHGAPFTRLIDQLPSTMPFVAPEALARKSGRPIRLRLGANESPFGPSPEAREAMRRAADEMEWYADPESYELRSALAIYHATTIDHIVVGSGIDDLLGLVVRVFLDRGDVAVASYGAYPTFAYHVAGYGARLETVPYHNDMNDLEALAQAAHAHGARLVYLSNPDNPSGSWHDGHELARFLETLPAGCSLVLDEAYCDFAPDAQDVPVSTDDPRLLRLRTFSKAYGLAGARVGYALAAPAAIIAFEKIRLHFGVNRAAQDGALAALRDTNYLRDVVRWNAAGREEYITLARELGMRPLPSATNFVSMDTGSAERAQAIMQALARRDVFIRMPGVPPLNSCIRVTIGTPEQRAAFATELRAVWPVVAELG